MKGGKREGAGRPAPNGEMVNITVRLPITMVDALDKRALSRSEFIRYAINCALKKPA